MGKAIERERLSNDNDDRKVKENAMYSNWLKAPFTSIRHTDMLNLSLPTYRIRSLLAAPTGTPENLFKLPSVCITLDVKWCWFPSLKITMKGWRVLNLRKRWSSFFQKENSVSLYYTQIRNFLNSFTRLFPKQGFIREQTTLNSSPRSAKDFPQRLIDRESLRFSFPLHSMTFSIFFLVRHVLS